MVQMQMIQTTPQPLEPTMTPEGMRHLIVAMDMERQILQARLDLRDAEIESLQRLLTSQNDKLRRAENERTGTDGHNC